MSKKELVEKKVGIDFLDTFFTTVKVGNGTSDKETLEIALKQLYQEMVDGKKRGNISYNVMDNDELTIDEVFEGMVVKHDDFKGYGVVYKINKKTCSVKFKNGENYNISGGLKSAGDFEVSDLVSKERIPSEDSSSLHIYLKHEGNVFLLPTKDKGDILVVLGKVNKVNTKAHIIDNNERKGYYSVKSRNLDKILKIPR